MEVVESSNQKTYPPRERMVHTNRSWGQMSALCSRRLESYLGAHKKFGVRVRRCCDENVAKNWLSGN